MHGRVADWNAKAAEITGYSRADAEGELLVERFIAADHQASVRDVLAKALRGEQTSNYELPMLTKGGARVEVRHPPPPARHVSDSA